MVQVDPQNRSAIPQPDAQLAKEIKDLELRCSDFIQIFQRKINCGETITPKYPGRYKLLKNRFEKFQSLGAVPLTSVNAMRNISGILHRSHRLLSLHCSHLFKPSNGSFGPTTPLPDIRRGLKRQRLPSAVDNIREEQVRKRRKITNELEEVEGIHNAGANCWVISSYQLLSKIPGLLGLLPDSLGPWKTFSGDDRVLRASLNQHLRSQSLSPFSAHDYSQEDAMESVVKLLSAIPDAHNPAHFMTYESAEYDVSSLPPQIDSSAFKTRSGSVPEVVLQVPFPREPEASDDAQSGKKESKDSKEAPRETDQGVNFEELLTSYFTPSVPHDRYITESIEGTEHTLAATQESIKLTSSLPRELLIGFRRFVFDKEKSTASKIKTEVKNIPLEFSPKDDYFTDPSANTEKYSLKGGIIHLGSTVRSGHYISIVKAKDEWHLCNDSHVMVITQDEALNHLKNAYLLHFSKTQ